MAAAYPAKINAGFIENRRMLMGLNILSTYILVEV